MSVHPPRSRTSTIEPPWRRIIEFATCRREWNVIRGRPARTSNGWNSRRKKLDFRIGEPSDARNTRPANPAVRARCSRSAWTVLGVSATDLRDAFVLGSVLTRCPSSPSVSVASIWRTPRSRSTSAHSSAKIYPCRIPVRSASR